MLSFEIPADIRTATADMDVSEELLRRYCMGPHVEHLAHVAGVRPPIPETPVRHTSVGVIDLEQLFAD